MSKTSQPKLKASLKGAPLAIFAGRGDLPHLIIKAAASQGRPVYIVAFEEQTDTSITQDLPHIWVHFGQVGKVTSYLKENGITDFVMAGNMTRPTLKNIRPDWEGLKWVPKIAAKALGDDDLLRAVMEMLENYGLKALAVDEILDTLIAPKGSLTQAEPDDQAWKDIHRGVDILKRLSAADVGQAVAVQNGIALAVEAIEGTDQMIARAGILQQQGPGGVLIKLSKRGQDRRADLPTVGLETLKALKNAGLRGMAIEEGQTLMLHREEMIDFANQHDLFVVSVECPL